MSDKIGACPFFGHTRCRTAVFAGRYYVTCPDCNCFGPLADTEAAAVAAWNRAGFAERNALEALRINIEACKPEYWSDFHRLTSLSIINAVLPPKPPAD